MWVEDQGLSTLNNIRADCNTLCRILAHCQAQAINAQVQNAARILSGLGITLSLAASFALSLGSSQAITNVYRPLVDRPEIVYGIVNVLQIICT